MQKKLKRLLSPTNPPPWLPEGREAGLWRDLQHPNTHSLGYRLASFRRTAALPSECNCTITSRQTNLLGEKRCQIPFEESGCSPWVLSRGAQPDYEHNVLLQSFRSNNFTARYANKQVHS